MTLDVVVVTHDSSAHLRECLAALPASAAVTVVDNASLDGSAEMAQSLSARVIRNAENKGFAAAANQGARSGSAELVLFLNPDAVLVESDLRTLMGAFDSDPQLGAAAPRLLHPDGSEQRAWWPFPSARATWLEALALHRLRPAGSAQDGTVPYLVGACLCVRRAAFEQVDGFDERFWLYGEDADLGLRLRRAGWSSRVVPEAVARHVGGASGEGNTWRSFEHFQRGAELFVEKHAGRTALASHRLGLLVGSAARLPVLAFRRDDTGRARFATRKAIVRRLARVLARRWRNR
jgi:N-acetylglucosaminyl-diphospho-decaprenol L-rhamnosyltransferase